MFVKEAREYFIGKNGKDRLNCAQSVIMAFKNEFNIDDQTILNMKSYGAGNAPYGVCGAFYSTRMILENKNSVEINNFEKYFMDKVGALKCNEIKSKKKISCVGCVERCAEFIQSRID